MPKIPLIKPYITPEVKEKVCEVLDSGYLTEGPITAQFEEAFKDYIGCDHALAVTSCTTGLEMALRALNIGPGDEVILPDYTYPATASVVAIIGAKIVIVDIDPQTMLIDYRELEKAITPKTKAVIPVSLFGNPLDYDRLGALQKAHGFYIIEDAACAVGSEFNGAKVGNLADISVFSFHPRKFITTGEGGIVTTNNSNWAKWMFSYKHFGMGKQGSRSTTTFERIGTNYKLSNILAAVGLVQMRHIEKLLNRRLEIADHYIELLIKNPNVRIPQTTAKGKHSRQSFCIYVDRRDEIMAAMRSNGVEVQIGTYALHQHPAFLPGPGCELRGSMSGSTYAFDHCLTLPLYHELTQGEQQIVVDELIRLLKVVQKP